MPIKKGEVRKLPILASYAWNFISNFFKVTKIWLVFAQLHEEDSTDCFVLQASAVDRFQNKVCIVPIKISAGQEKKNKILHITMTLWRNGSSYNWLLITENLIRGNNIRIKHKNCSRQSEFELLNMNFYSFCSKGTSQRFWLLVCSGKGVYEVWVLKLLRVNWVYKFAADFENCLLKFKWNPSKILEIEELVILSFLPSVRDLIRNVA